MPTEENLDKNIASELPRSCQRAVVDAWDFACQTALHLDKRAKQAEVLAHGLVVGGLKAAQDQIVQHPKDTATKLIGFSLLGSAVNALYSSKFALLQQSMKLATIALGVASPIFAYSEFKQNRDLQKALHSTWRSDDLARAQHVVDTEIGTAAANFGLASAATFGGGYGHRIGSSFFSYLKKEVLSYNPFLYGLESFGFNKVLPCIKAAGVRTVQKELYGFSIIDLAEHPTLRTKPTAEDLERIEMTQGFLKKHFPNIESRPKTVARLEIPDPEAPAVDWKRLVRENYHEPSMLYVDWDVDVLRMPRADLDEFMHLCRDMRLNFLSKDRVYLMSPK